MRLVITSRYIRRQRSVIDDLPTLTIPRIALLYQREGRGKGGGRKEDWPRKKTTAAYHPKSLSPGAGAGVAFFYCGHEQSLGLCRAAHYVYCLDLYLYIYFYMEREKRYTQSQPKFVLSNHEGLFLLCPAIVINGDDPPIHHPPRSRPVWNGGDPVTHPSFSLFLSPFSFLACMDVTRFPVHSSPCAHEPFDLDTDFSSWGGGFFLFWGGERGGGTGTRTGSTLLVPSQKSAQTANWAG